MIVTVKTDELLHWARTAEQISRNSKAAVARALNAFGVGVVRAAAEAISEQTDLAVDDVIDGIEVEEATPDHLHWGMDASAVTPMANQWERPWEQREVSQFGLQKLVKIITLGDHAVCEVCEEAAQNSPYTIQEINEMKAKWADFTPATGEGIRTNLVHPNCRCVTQPWSMTRRLPMTMGTGPAAPRELLNARQLGRAVAAELTLELKVK